MAQRRVRGAPRDPSATRRKAPPHPFPELQGPFEESMSELERQEEHEVPSDAASRRTILLDAPTYERVIAGRWRQRPGEKYHPLWKIVAQLSFGLHLLAENLAKSEDEVMQILQGHIDEIDLFLERTTEDFALAQEDIAERMRCLQLPLQHPKVFDRMLEDRAFRNSIVEGNEKIEHIVARTVCAMKDSLKDAQKGLDATASLEQYLAGLEDSWNRQSEEHQAVFDAMLENVEGWRAAFVDLHEQGDKLGRLLKQLTDVINQMQQRAGEISRRLIKAQQKHSHSPTNSAVTAVSRHSASSAGDGRSRTSERPSRKPLPGVPTRDSARQSVRHSANQGQRCETAQSSRSGVSQRSSNAYPSRASSREGINPSLRDSAQSRLNTKSPRIVEIKRHHLHDHEPSQPVFVPQTELPTVDERVLQPTELAAGPLIAAVRNGIVTEINASNTGLGIMHTEVPLPSEDMPQNTPPGPPSFVHGATNANQLPLTPSSMNSTRNSAERMTHELPSEPTPKHATLPSLASIHQAAGVSISSPPTTPSWAKQTFDVSERDRMVVDKLAFRSHPPHVDLGSPPVVFPQQLQSQTQHARFNASVASSLGAPGPEVASSESAHSVKSGSADTRSVQSSTTVSNQLVEKTVATTTTEPPTSNDGKKTFVAELEGNTPVLLHPTIYSRQMMRDSARQVTHETIELEGPSYSLPSAGSASVHAEGTTPIERKMAAAIRKSFIATNIELPAAPVDYGRISSTRVIDRSSNGPVELPAEQPNIELHDIIAQFDHLNATSPNLSLKGADALTTLPATTYVADRPLAPRLSTSPVTANPDISVTSPSSLAGHWSDSGPTPPRPEWSTRNSSGSNASSQSQWRAFFKGQLSPSDFNSSSPNVPSKVNSTHKAIIELKRRGQEPSPTLGWQWTPGSPEAQRRVVDRTNS